MKQNYNPLVSVITIVYNAASTLERTIQSVLNQNYKNIEYIIIDGASTDGSLDIIERYKSHLSYFVSEKDSGIYEAMNKGVKKAKGEIIGILNSDDWYNESAIKTAVEMFKDSSVEIAYGNALMYYPNEPLRERRLFNAGIPLEAMWYCMAIAHPATFVRSSVYAKMGLFDESFKIAGDYEFILRCYASGIKFKKTEEVLTNFTDGGYSIRNFVLCNQETIKINMDYIDSCPVPELVKEKNIKRLENEKYQKLLYALNKGTENLFLNLGLNIKEGLAIWGTGRWAMNIYNYCVSICCPVLFFIDNNKEKWDSVQGNVKVKSPEVLKQHSGTVLIAVKDYDTDIAEQIKMFNNPALKVLLLRDLIQ